MVYIFTTTEGQKPSSTNLNLTSQLTKLVDPTGLTSLVASAILSPTGSKACDLYLMDFANAKAFESKVDQQGGKYYTIVSASRENYRNGTVQVKDVTKGTWYLGFKNPSASTGIGITFEVAAVVEETIVNASVWSKEAKDNLYNHFQRNISNNLSDASVAKDVAQCLTTKMVESKTPFDYDRMSQNEKEVWINTLYSSCLEKFKITRTEEQEKAANYGNLGWHAFENGDINKCIEYSKKALQLDNTAGWIKANLALCYLIKGEESLSTDLYIEALGDFKKVKILSSRKTYFQGVIDDIDNASKKFQTMKGHENIKALFRRELNNL